MDHKHHHDMRKKGQLIGEVYEIVRLLGRSAIDDAYLVRSLVTGKHHVLKLLLREYTGNDAYEEFFEEKKRSIHDFIHPNIAAVDKAACCDGDYFLVYSFVASAGDSPKTLYDRIHNYGKMHEFQAKNILLQICGALSHVACAAPAPGIFHFSLKPSNILFDSSNRIRITDIYKPVFAPEAFLRQLLSESGYSHTALTRLGIPHRMLEAYPPRRRSGEDIESTLHIDMTHFSIAGRQNVRSRRRMLSSMRREARRAVVIDPDEITDPRLHSIVETFAFISPEQKDGQVPDERSTVYSLGAILYFMLAGEPMQPDDYQPLTNSTAAERWNEIILKCTAYEAENRYASIAELQQAIIQNKKTVRQLPLAVVYSIVAVFWLLLLVLIISWVYQPLSAPAPEATAEYRPLPLGSTVGAPARESLLELTVKPVGATLKISRNETIIQTVAALPSQRTRYHLAPGNYLLTISKTGCQPLRQQLQLTPGLFQLTLQLDSNTDIKARQYAYTHDGQKPHPGFAFVIPKLQLELLPVAPGTFMMGDAARSKNPDHSLKSARRETISRPFWMARDETTQRIYEELMLQNPSVYGPAPNRPVERVSWHNATEFCRRLTQREQAAGRLPDGYEYRLPDEKEWEYCCRADSTTVYNFGDNPTLVDDYARYNGNSFNETGEVGRKKPNRWGFRDMHGNVAEWTGDYYEADAVPPHYVLRGGSWKDIPSYMRSGSRVVVDSPDYSDSHTGFRIVLAPSRPDGTTSQDKATATNP
ncbi:MAG: SUMF1/EgtB/PvdO family nonheme iron enzyme [Victivallales bacterium]|nr:SUMF1/EgtB/PvdO family nonheme iron enzyme [Victivallales bacterium]